MSEIKEVYRRIGGRTVAGMATALAAAVLIFAAPEVGLLGGIGGVIAGGVSAILMRPHSM